MKRIFVLVMIVFLAVGALLTAEESVLINFSELTGDGENYSATNPSEDEETKFYFGSQAGSSVTTEQKNEMFTSLAIHHWEVELASSSSHVQNIRYSQVNPAQVRESSESDFAGDWVLGVRVHFPTEPFNSWALVTPPFEIPAYADVVTFEEDQNGNMKPTPVDGEKPGSKFEGKGVVKNVGVLRAIKVNVRGLNFPHTFSILLQDQNNDVREIFMGNLNFDGWNMIEWENPNYIDNVRDRQIYKVPLYPNSVPMVKLVGLRFYRDASHVGSDFITYIKDITLYYDKAVLELESDIDHDQVWGILSERERARREAEAKRLGDTLVQRHLEENRMDKTYDEPGAAPTTEENTNE